MKTVHVELDDRGYDIGIGSGAVPGAVLADASGVRVLIVSDSNVDPLYGDGCERALQERGLQTSRVVVPAGELSKSLSSVQELYDSGFAAGLDRHSVMVALGGGMVGDLTGFAAATFLRGIRFLQIPTTLLAMVDSSVGGKTGVNVSQGKNLIGAFYQPLEVTADLTVLASLPDREYAAGLAEVIKYGVIWDASFFDQLESHVEGLMAKDPDLLEAVIARCCEIKAEVVAVDERESGVRAILNFGHTFGHALEKELGYGQCLHGEAVALGMVYAARVSAVEKGFSEASCDRIVALLKRVGLPVGDLGAVDWEKIRSAMSLDKKSRDSVPRLVLAEELGRVVFGCDVDEQTLREAFAHVLGS